MVASDMLASNLQLTKNPSVGDVFRASPSPYSTVKPVQEMGHFIREARKLPRNNTFISLEAAKEECSDRFGVGKASLQRWNSLENLSSDRKEKEREEAAVLEASAEKSEQFNNNGSDSNEDDCSEAKEQRNGTDRRCSMIPLMANPVGRPKAYSDKEKLVRKKPPLPPKVVKEWTKNQDPIKIYRAERVQEKRLDLEHQLEEMKEQLTSIELNRQKEDQRNHETIDSLKQEINGLKTSYEKLAGAIDQLQNSDDLFAKIKHGGEFSFYARSYEVSKKILSNTFRRRKCNTAPRASCMDPNVGTSGVSDESILNDTTSSHLAVMPQAAGMSSGGDGDFNIRRTKSFPESTPMNIVTSMYYVSKMQSVGMDGISSEEVTGTGEPMNEDPETELMTKKKSKSSKFGGWFRSSRK